MTDVGPVPSTFIIEQMYYSTQPGINPVLFKNI